MTSISNVPGFNPIPGALGGDPANGKAGIGGQPNVGNGNMAARGLPSGLNVLGHLLGGASSDPLANVSRGSTEDAKGASAQAIQAKLAEINAGGGLSGSLASMIGRLMIEMAQDQREQAMKDRAAAREAAQSELLSQAGQMQKAASEMMKGAITNAVLGGLAAGVSGLSSMASFAKQGKELTKMNSALGEMKSLDGAMDAATKAGDKLQAGDKIGMKQVEMHMKQLGTLHQNASNAFSVADKASAKFQSLSGGIDQLAGAAKAAGASTDGAMQAEAKKLDAAGSKDAAQAEYQKQMADAQQEVMDNMKQMMQQIINFIKEMQDAEVEAMRSITRA